MLTSLFSLFYVTGEFHRFLHRGRAQKRFTKKRIESKKSRIPRHQGIKQIRVNYFNE